MELIEGAPLGEHFSSLKEKRQHFTEERLWRIFIQVHPPPTPIEILITQPSPELP